MVRMDGAETRKERISQIARMIQSALYQSKQQGFIPLKKTVSSIEIETGLTEPKIMKILELLQSAGQIQIDLKNDKITKASA